MRIRSVFCLLSSVAMIVALAGCGDSGDSLERLSVSGVVKLDGQPLESGTISFTPSDGMNPTSGGTISKGRYSVEVPPGQMKISISSPKVVGKQKAYDTPDSPEIDITEDAVPANYNANTTLEHTVTESINDLDFGLKSGE